jgi:Big-like domain-containing protein
MKQLNRLLIVTLLILLTAGSVFAAGKTEEDAFETVEGTGNWEHTIDVSELEPGKYNILVRARDRAGNEALGGPFNIFVDPESDQPLVSISYPTALQAVGERLYIIGTARDDDAVGRVEVQVDDRRAITAEGTDFWSLFVSMEALDDGPHTITVKAVDINGTEGPAVSIPVELDTTKPVALTESHESGVLVSRKTTIQGSVEDANGVAALYLIAGDSESTLRLRGGREETPSFEFQIDPNDLEEGPTVWWLRSVDNTGSIGFTPFLFFVDISPPELEIITPLEEDSVDNQLNFVGRVYDAVGLQSLTYSLSNGEEGEIAVIPGNPYWSLQVDLGPDAGGSLNADFMVEDVAGNSQELKLRYKLDLESDEPIVSLVSPVEGELTDGPAIVGHVIDDDGAAAVLYSIDGAEPIRVSSAGSFMVPVGGLAWGAHEVRISAEDLFGRVGPEVRRRFTVGEPLPGIELSSVLIGEENSPYRPGFTLAAGGRATVVGSVSGDFIPDRIEFRVGATVGRANVGDDGSFSVPLPRGEVGAAIPIDVWFASVTGRIARTTGFFVQLPAVEEGAAAPVISAVLRPGLYLGPETGDATSAPAEMPVAFDAPILLQRGQKLQLLAVGGNPSAAAMEPESAAFEVSTSGSYVVITARADGYVDGAAVSATVGSSSRTSTRFSLATELDPAEITVPSQAVGAWIASATPFAVAAEDPAGVATVRSRLILNDRSFEGSWTPAELSGEGNYVGSVAMPAEDGQYSVEVEVSDESGVTGTLLVPVFIDRAEPKLTVLTPAGGESVNGVVSIIGQLTESTTQSVAVTVGGERTELDVSPTIVFTVAATTEASAIEFELVDRAGNLGTQTVNLMVDDEADRPILQVQVPEEGGVVRQEFRLSGVLLDDDAPASISYSVDGGDFVDVATTGVFDVTIPMANLEDGEHTLAIVGADTGGTETETIVRNVVLSRTEPASELDSPTIDDYLRDEIVLSGRSADPNGIVGVHVSTDNGNSYQLARGTEEWTYRLDTTQLDDGTHSVLVRATDGAETPGLLTTTINVDNTPPILELTRPYDGSTVSGTFLIDGRSEDDALSVVRLVAQHLSDDNNESAVLATFEASGPFAYTVDTSSLPIGWYNLRVEAEDLAGNTRRISLNLKVEPAQAAAAPQIMSPADGSLLSHQFRINVRSAVPSVPLTLLVDGRPLSVVQVDDAGNGSLLIEPGAMQDGARELQLRAEADESGNELISEISVIEYSTLGPWIAVDEPASASFVRDRPYLSGRAGYALELPEGDDKETDNARKALVSAHEVDLVEISTDNGRSFEAASGTDEWRYRIETTEMPDGQVNLLVRTRYTNGESVVVRHSVVVDEKAPVVRLLTPQERDQFDQSVRIVGVTTDDNALDEVAVVLRQGDKSRYTVPGFIEGLYVDLHGLGATYFDVGAGLTFFDDNVRLQAQVGVSPPGRFSGLVMGVKLLANVFSFPFSFVFGPDLDFLSAAIAIGANFSYFTMSDDTIGFTPDGLILAGMVAQLEFPRITLESLPVFNTFGFYTEAQLWFISSDVEAGSQFKLAFGLRANIF